MSLSTLAGSTVVKASITWPAWGLWWTEVDVSDPAQLSGQQTLTIAGTEFAGTVMTGGAFNGRASYRLVAGGGGVNKALPKKGYVNDAGVALSLVLADAAREAGETLSLSGVTARLGPHYARKKDETLGDLLQRHFPGGWYADPDGTIRIGTRAATTYTGTAPRVRVDPAGNVIDLAVDSLEGLAPGVQVDGSSPATDLQIDLTPERLTVRVYAAKRTSRRLDAYRRIMRAVFPSLAYLGVWEYRVVNATGERLNLQPVRVASGMPDLRNVPVRPGVFGLKATTGVGNPPGELVLVCFADGDPSRPQVFAHDAADAPSWLPFAASLVRPLARIGDLTATGGPVAPLTTPSAVSAI